MSPKYRPPQSRSAFTLVEMLVVITIIGILAGLITAAAIRALTTSKNAVISMEINQLDMALKAYKEKFGEYPPDMSGLDGSLGATIQTAAQQAVRRHVAKAFPRCTSVDFNATIPGTSLTLSDLSPQTALVFWLGGLTDATGNFIGFSANPTNPFDNTTPSRIGPFFDFDRNRINNYRYYPQNITPNATNAYVYFRAENSNYTYDGAANGTIKSFTPTGTPATTVRPAADWRLTSGTNYVWINPSSFQIFSPGLDGVYGNLSTAVLQFPNGPYPAEARDNITNFSNGTLESAMQ